MARVKRISGPVVTVELEEERASLFEVVKVGRHGLIGEIVSIEGEEITVQVYEDTTGLQLGEKVKLTGSLLSVELGPGLLGNILDGLGRPLSLLGEKVEKGATATYRVPKIEFKPVVKEGDLVSPGHVIGVVDYENFQYKVISPYRGRVEKLKKDTVPSGEPVALVGNNPVFVYQKRILRKPSPYIEKLEPSIPLLTGQRIIDFLFPIAKGGTAAIPGGFGTGKTVLQQTLAKWSNADVIVYVGCGERGNEMAEVLEEFPELEDPRSGRRLIERTVLIANTSDMPVSAREASVYLALTIGEFFRDMGYSVAVMADSTSRWAEAMREISGRLGELPVEEGYPANIASRIASIYERAGRVITLSGEEGSLSITGAVSPPGGDFSEPVTRHTKRFISVFWALDRELASSRFYPAINYNQSYSLYVETVKEWWEERFKGWSSLRQWMVEVLQEDEKLQRLVKLLGKEALPEDQKLKVEIAEIIKEAFLRQSAFDPVDCYSSPEKQFRMAEVIKLLSNWWWRVFQVKKVPVSKIVSLPIVEKVMKMKYAKEKELEVLKEEVETVYREFLGEGRV